MDYMFLPLKRYAEFSGRSRRKEYWLYALFLVILWAIFFGVLFGVAGSALLAGGRGGAGALLAGGGTIMIVALLGVIVWLGLLIPSLAVAVRRLHDTERSGWWLGGYIIVAMLNNVVTSATGGGGLARITMVAVLVYAVTLLVFFCFDGTKGPNRYGPDPKGEVDARVFA
jgi:uncharacterized membrane protein YhaH (DUF805 family)